MLRRAKWRVEPRPRITASTGSAGRAPSLAGSKGKSLPAGAGPPFRSSPPSAPVGGSAASLQGSLAHGFLQRPERREILGRTPGDEARPVVLPAEARGQRSWPGLRQPVEQLQRQPCEPGPGRHREEGGGAGAQHGGNPPAGLPEQPFQDGVEGWLHVAGRAGTGPP